MRLPSAQRDDVVTHQRLINGFHAAISKQFELYTDFHQLHQVCEYGIVALNNVKSTIEHFNNGSVAFLLECVLRDSVY